MQHDQNQTTVALTPEGVRFAAMVSGLFASLMCGGAAVAWGYGGFFFALGMSGFMFGIVILLLESVNHVRK